MKTIGIFQKMMVLAALVAGSAFAQVATLVELKGAAQATPAVGAPRDLRMGDSLNQGETINTKGMTSAVIRFEDGQTVALTQNSRFAISSYVYNKAEPAKSSMVLSLLDGGMRAVTGLIGKAKPENVTYKAANATIGIRGTDVVFAINGQNVIVSVVSGQVSFRIGNGAPVTINAGQGARVDTTNPNAPVVVLPATAIAQAAQQASGDLGAALTALNNATLAVTQQNAAATQAVQGSTTATVTNRPPGNSSSGSVGIGGGQNCSAVPKPSGC